MKDFELAVAQQITRVHALERALHDEGPWELRSGCWSTPLRRRVEPTELRVVFSGYMHGGQGGTHAVDLLSNGEMVSSRLLDLPAGMADIEWELSLPSAVAA